MAREKDIVLKEHEEGNIYVDEEDEDWEEGFIDIKKETEEEVEEVKDESK